VLIIAGIRFSFIPETPACPYSFAAAYQPFIQPEISADKSHAAGRYIITPPDVPRLSPIQSPPFWSNEIWRMGLCRPHEIAIEIHDVIQSRWVPVANVAEDFSTGTIQPFYGRRAAPAPHALNYPYDQAILINRLLFNQVTIIHGAGIVTDGHGYVFFGPSGIGKTTISRLWVRRGAKLLNDDRVALYKDASGWRIAGTPWHGEEPVVCPDDAPLRGIVRLRQSPTTRMRPLSAVEGLSELLSCALIPFFSKSGIESAMDLMSGMVEDVPFVELALRPENESLDYFLANM